MQLASGPPHDRAAGLDPGTFVREHYLNMTEKSPHLDLAEVNDAIVSFRGLDGRNVQLARLTSFRILHTAVHNGTARPAA
jgi:hypothetical protein